MIAAEHALLDDALRMPGEYLSGEVWVPPDATHVRAELSGREAWMRLQEREDVLTLTIEINRAGQWDVAGQCTTDASVKRDRSGQVMPLTSLRVRLPRERIPQPQVRVHVTLASPCPLALSIQFDDAALPPVQTAEHHSVTYDTDNEISGTVVSSITIGAFAVANQANRYMVVGVAGYDESASNSAVSSISHNSSTAGWAELITNTGPGSSINRASLWGKVAPAVVSSTVVVTCGGTSNEIFANALSAYAVDQTTPTASPVSAEASGTGTPSVNVTATVDDLVYDCVYMWTGFASGLTHTATPGANQVSRMALEVEYPGPSESVYALASSEPGATTTTMSWSVSSTAGDAEWVQVAVALKGALLAPVYVFPPWIKV